MEWVGWILREFIVSGCLQISITKSAIENIIPISVYIKYKMLKNLFVKYLFLFVCDLYLKI